MNGLISFDPMSLSVTQSVSREILELNEISKEYGLMLSAEEALVLSETRGRALADNERIEIGVGAVAEIIKRFSSSRYVSEENYAWILGEITEIFYYIKTETNDKISDGALLDELFKCFELNCRGSLDLLFGRGVEQIIRKVTSGENYGKWYGGDDDFSGDASRNTPEEALRDEFDAALWSEDEDAYIEDEFYDGDDDIQAELDAFDELLDALANEDNGTEVPVDLKEESDE